MASCVGAGADSVAGSFTRPQAPPTATAVTARQVMNRIEKARERQLISVRRSRQAKCRAGCGPMRQRRQNWRPITR